MLTPTIYIMVLSLACSSVAVTNYFMDCNGNNNILDILKRCCQDDQLPKGCECFDTSVKSGFTNSLLHKPACPNSIDVTFNLFTRRTRTQGQKIRAGKTHIKSTDFCSCRMTYFIAHGFTDYGLAPWILEMKNALLDQRDCNVILVNWQAGARAPNYYQAVANTRTVGAMIGRLIQDLHLYQGVSYNDFHLIGHSLGAQIMGYGGKEIFRLTGVLLGRITGLDPAGPAFERYNAYVRIDKSDAQFVDIIHTDAESLINAGFGMRNSVGHVDFYPNGGKHQPGCPAKTLGILSLINFELEKKTSACSHSRAVDLFTNSIHKCRWHSPTAGSTCTMGFHLSGRCSGDHYPTTTATAPFC